MQQEEGGRTERCLELPEPPEEVAAAVLDGPQPAAAWLLRRSLSRCASSSCLRFLPALSASLAALAAFRRCAAAASMAVHLVTSLPTIRWSYAREPVPLNSFLHSLQRRCLLAPETPSTSQKSMGLSDVFQASSAAEAAAALEVDAMIEVLRGAWF